MERGPLQDLGHAKQATGDPCCERFRGSTDPSKSQKWEVTQIAIAPFRLVPSPQHAVPIHWTPPAATALLNCEREGQVDQYRVSEATVLRLWEEYSGREMTQDERALASGHKLVAFLRTFPEPVLMSAAFTARRRGEDLDWAAWRDWAIRRNKQRDRERPKPKRASMAASERTDRIFNAASRVPSRYTTESGKASARAPGYSGGTLPHARGKPSKHY